MMGLLSALSFINPWALAGLAVLPALWFLLRVTPPAPQHVILPSARFLLGLSPERIESAKTPWWILLLRLLIVALVIFSFARPILSSGDQITGSGPVRLIIDNGWASAPGWEQSIKLAENIITQAARAQREIYILSSAPEGELKTPRHEGPLSEADALSFVRNLQPLPWAVSHQLM